MSRDDFTIAAADFPDPFRLLVRESVESTNDEVRILAKAGAPDGLVAARRATKPPAADGAGRHGFRRPASRWHFPSSSARRNRKRCGRDWLWPQVSRWRRRSNPSASQAGIKWPNDVWIGRRKVAGILVEAGKDFAVVGIGLNVNTTAFPAEVAEIATSLRIETSHGFSRAEVLGGDHPQFRQAAPADRHRFR